MSFQGRAWRAAADEYGKARAEKYGKVARFFRAVQLLVIVGLALGVGYLWALGHHG